MKGSWDCFKFDLSLPTRANNLVRPAVVGPVWRRRFRLVKTKEGKAWLAKAIDRIQSLAATLGYPRPLAGPVRLYAKFRFSTIASDGDGPLKALQDALSGYVWEDDRQVADWVLGKRICAPGESEMVTVMVVDVSGDPEHQVLEARLIAAKKRPPRKRKKPTRQLGLQPAVYRKGKE